MNTFLLGIDENIKRSLIREIGDIINLKYNGIFKI
jgi:hypothetical protein